MSQVRLMRWVGLAASSRKRLAKTQPVERVNGIGRQVDVGADPGETGGLLEQRHPMAGPAQGDRAGEAADSAPTMPILSVIRRPRLSVAPRDAARR